MVNRFGFAVSFEVGEATIGGAVGMAHDEDALGLVQADRHADLLQDEVLLEVVARGGQCFRASGNDDHVRMLDVLLLQKFADGLVDPMIETAEHRRLGDVRRVGRIEMENLAHGSNRL